jgi:hypothetical protein
MSVPNNPWDDAGLPENGRVVDMTIDHRARCIVASVEFEEQALSLNRLYVRPFDTGVYQELEPLSATESQRAPVYHPSRGVLFLSVVFRRSGGAGGWSADSGDLWRCETTTRRRELVAKSSDFQAPAPYHRLFIRDLIDVSLGGDTVTAWAGLTTSGGPTFSVEYAICELELSTRQARILAPTKSPFF